MNYIQDQYRQVVSLPRTVRIFYLSDIFFAVAMAIFSTLFNLHLLEIGYNENHIGQIQSVSSLAMAFVAIPVGLAGDRWGRRWLYVAGSFLFGIPFAVMPWLTNYPLLMTIYVLGTVGSTLMFVNESPLLAGEVGSDRRASVFSFMMVNFFLWNTLGIQLAGFLSNWLPRGIYSQYEWPLVIGGLCGITAGVIRAFLPFRKQAPARKGLNLKPNRVTVLLALVSITAGGYMALTQNFNNVILARRFDYSADYISTILTIAGIVGWCGSLLVPWTSRKFGDLKAYVLAVGLQGLVFIYMGFADMPSWFLAGFWARSVLGTMQMSLFNAFAMGVTPDDERATANSYAMVGRNIGSALAAKGYGLALATGSFLLPFVAAGLCALGTALLTMAAFRKQPGTTTGESIGA